MWLCKLVSEAAVLYSKVFLDVKLPKTKIYILFCLRYWYCRIGLCYQPPLNSNIYFVLHFYTAQLKQKVLDHIL